MTDDEEFQEFMSEITKDMPITSRIYIKEYVNNKINEEIIKTINDNVDSKLLFKISSAKRVVDSLNNFFD